MGCYNSVTSRCLVIGLDNSGKSCILNRILTGQFTPTRIENPTNPLGHESTYQILTIDHNKISIDFWDVSGHKDFRKYWGTHINYPDSIIFVVDASDEYRLGEYSIYKSEGYRVYALRCLIDGYLKECINQQTLEKIPFEIQIMCLDYIGSMSQQLMDRKAVEEFHDFINRNIILCSDELKKYFYANKLLVLANKQDVHGALSGEVIEQGLGLKEIIHPSGIQMIECSAKTGQGLEQTMSWVTRNGIEGSTMSTNFENYRF